MRRKNLFRTIAIGVQTIATGERDLLHFKYRKTVGDTKPSSRVGGGG